MLMPKLENSCPSADTAPYWPAAIEAMAVLRQAMDEAASLLPAAVTRQYFIVGHHSPAAWRSVESWFRIQPVCDLTVAETLTDLALMSEALACLTSVTKKQKEKPLAEGWNKLAKTRRPHD